MSLHRGVRRPGDGAAARVRGGMGLLRTLQFRAVPARSTEATAGSLIAGRSAGAEGDGAGGIAQESRVDSAGVDGPRRAPRVSERREEMVAGERVAGVGAWNVKISTRAILKKWFLA